MWRSAGARRGRARSREHPIVPSRTIWPANGADDSETAEAFLSRIAAEIDAKGAAKRTNAVETAGRDDREGLDLALKRRPAV